MIYSTSSEISSSGHELVSRMPEILFSDRRKGTESNKCLPKMFITDVSNEFGSQHTEASVNLFGFMEHCVAIRF